MRFDKEEFKKWFDPKTNMANPTIPPETLWDIVWIVMYFATFGLIIVPIALLDSTHIR